MRRLIVMIASFLLAGCSGTLVSQTFSNVGTSLPVESTASEAVDATITVIGGGAVGGPGASIDDALANSGSEPMLVNGVLLMDLDGVIWLCESVDESASPPECGEPRLRVADYPEGGAEWDPSSAEMTGLQEQDGVLWLEGNQVFGVVRP
ncbi:MAG: hypothetical protein H0U86_10480 [Chloroflexi bacterium]|nr:hypothetical protein [Chloroflexota bacterium]